MSEHRVMGSTYGVPIELRVEHSVALGSATNEFLGELREYNRIRKAEVILKLSASLKMEAETLENDKEAAVMSRRADELLVKAEKLLS